MARTASVGGAERRAAIISELAAATQPVSGSALAKAVGVSRQVVVQDIALLRADGHDIVATSRGYVLQEGKGASQVPTRLLRSTMASMTWRMSSRRSSTWAVPC